MNTKPSKLLSVIIPAYNAADTLPACVSELANPQYAKDIEIILVNDGSTDDTKSVIKELQANYSNTSSIEIANGGPANARNIGLNAAIGQYVYFVDADDIVEPSLLENIFTYLQKNSFEIIVFGFSIVDPTGKIVTKYCSPKDFNIESKKELSEHLPHLYTNNLLNQVWNKVFKREFLTENSITFEDYSYGEDRLFVLKALQASNKIKIIDKCLYNYGAGFKESLITKYYGKKFEVNCLIDVRLKELASSCGEISDHDREMYDYMFIKGIISCITNLYAKSCHLSFQQKKHYTREILTNPQVLESLETEFERPLYFKFMVWILRSENVYAVLLLAWILVMVNQISPKIFIRFKRK